jgi:hypothetical protein
LGYKSDEAALKKFESGITSATKSVFGLATAIEVTAVSVAAGVAKFASNLEALYFASIKTNSSATNLRAFDRAAQNLGTTSGEALQSVQGLARFLRSNPGGEGMLESLGVHTRDANHQLRDSTDLLVDLGKQMATKPYYMANQYAGIFGISEDTMRAMMNGDFAAQVAKMRAEMKNTGFDQASKNAHQFMMDLRDLQTQLEQFGVQIEDALQKKLGISLKSINEWLKVNGPWLADRIADVIGEIIELAEWVGEKIKWLIGKFVEWDKATDGWSTKLLATLVILKLFGGAEIIGGILSLAGAFVKLGAGAAGASASATTLMGVLGRIGLAGAAGAAGYAIGMEWIAPWIDKKIQELTGRKDETLGGWLYDATHQEGTPGAGSPSATPRPPGQASPWAKRISEWADSFTGKDNGVSISLQAAGYSRNQTAGILANLQRESQLDPGAVGDHGAAYGIAQWHKPGQDAFKAWSGADIHQSTLAQQVGFLVHDLETRERMVGNLLRNTQGAYDAGSLFSRQYERPAAADAEARLRGASAVQISQENNFHIHGTDPAATSRLVANEQTRVGADLVRNLQPAVQ